MKQATTNDSNISTPDPSPKVTGQLPFFTVNAGQQALFCVQPGIPQLDALQNASCLLDVAEYVSRNAAMAMDCEENPDCRLMWAAAYLVEIAHAVVTAAGDAAEEASA